MAARFASLGLPSAALSHVKVTGLSVGDTTGVLTVRRTRGDS